MRSWILFVLLFWPFLTHADANPCEIYLQRNLGAKGKLVKLPVNLSLNKEFNLKDSSHEVIKRHKKGFRLEILDWSDPGKPDNAKADYGLLAYRDWKNRVSELIYENETMDHNAGKDPKLLRSTIDFQYDKDTGQCTVHNHREVWLFRDKMGTSKIEELFSPQLSTCRAVLDGIKNGDSGQVETQINRYETQVPPSERPHELRDFGKVDNLDGNKDKIIKAYTDYCQRDDQYGLFLGSKK